MSKLWHCTQIRSLGRWDGPGIGERPLNGPTARDFHERHGLWAVHTFWVKSTAHGPFERPRLNGRTTLKYLFYPDKTYFEVLASTKLQPTFTTYIYNLHLQPTFAKPKLNCRKTYICTYNCRFLQPTSAPTNVGFPAI